MKKKIKVGDEFEFLAIRWEDPNFNYGSPVAMVKPYCVFSSNGETPEDLIEEQLIEIVSEKEPVIDTSRKDDDWNYKRFRTVARERLRGLETWESREAEVISMKIKFIKDEEGLFDWEMIEEETA